MRHALKVLLGLGLALGAAGCSDFLSGPGIASTSDPNNILSLKKPGPLYVAIQQAGPPQRQGQLARIAAEYTQQIAGVNRQQQQSFDRYGAKPADTDTYFAAVYGSSNVVTGGGGLLDIHKLQQIARTANDSLFIGIAKVYEAMYIGFAADFWGDIPYREAADSTKRTPHFDPQLQVYADMQRQLDSAINVFLPTTGATNLGPTLDGVELTYVDRGTSRAALRTVYAKVAHSLKARYYMHVAAASVAGVTGAPPAAYDSALAEAQLGIATTADDFIWFADASTSGNNVWWQFNSAREGDIEPGAALVEIMKRQIAGGFDDNQRLAFYFETADGAAPDLLGANFFGFRPGATVVPTNGTIYNGSGDATGSYSIYGAFIDPNFTDGSFRQPELTFAEMQLIAAEATWHINCPACGDSTLVAAAQPFLDAARASRQYGATSFGSAPGVLPASLENIIEEKYIALFLNPEVWNDFKRTCLPRLAPAPPVNSTTPGTSPIAGRVPYGQTEINANPNVPTTSSVGVTITGTSLNPNQPASCPVLNYTTPASNGKLAN